MGEIVGKFSTFTILRMFRAHTYFYFISNRMFMHKEMKT